jgi:desumoylating isopeptidase 1
MERIEGQIADSQELSNGFYHSHASLHLPTLQQTHKPILYTKVPPLEKLIAKLGPSGKEQPVTAMRAFIEARSISAASAPLPSLLDFKTFFHSSLSQVPIANIFPLVDLFRLALVDPRVSSYFAKEFSEQDIVHIVLAHVNSLGNGLPYALRLVTLQMACNLFSSPLYILKILNSSSLSSACIQLITSSLLDQEDVPARVSAASLAFNFASANHRQRLEQQRDILAESAQVELVACLLEAIKRESNPESAKSVLLALGLLAYEAPEGSDVNGILAVLDARAALKENEEIMKGEEGLVDEVIKVFYAADIEAATNVDLPGVWHLPQRFRLENRGHVRKNGLRHSLVVRFSSC